MPGAETTSDEAVECALRALRHRDRTAREVAEHLGTRGFSEDDRQQAVETLRRTGLVDDERFARLRAVSLAERGAGNALIRARLAEAGVAREFVDAALETVEEEAKRARRIVVSRGASARTARYLHRKGFSDDVVRAVIADEHDGELG